MRVEHLVAWMSNQFADHAITVKKGEEPVNAGSEVVTFHQLLHRYWRKTVCAKDLLGPLDLPPKLRGRLVPFR
jgi:hypothetical protein